MKPKTTKKRKKTPKEVSLPVYKHIEELKKRLFVTFGIFVAFTIIGYFFRDILIEIILKPIGDTIYFTSPAGGLTTLFNIILGFSFLLTLPFIIFQAVLFVKPAFFEYLPSLVKLFVSSFLLLFIGAYFAYSTTLPLTLNFLKSINLQQIQALITTNDYLNFVLRYLIAFGIIFQLPLIILLLNSIFKVSYKKIIKAQSWVVLVSFVFAGVITPTPDAFNQFVVAIPILVMFYLSVFIVYIKSKL